MRGGTAIGVAAMMLALAGCTYEVKPAPETQASAESGDEEAADAPTFEPVAVAPVDRPLAGTYAVVIDGARLDGSVQIVGLPCSAHKYQTALRAPYEQSMLNLFDAWTERHVVVDAPLGPAELAAGGYAEQLSVSALALNATFDATQHFFTVDVRALASLFSRFRIETAAETVQEGRLDTRTLHEEKGRVFAGCGGGNGMLGKAIEKAIAGHVADAAAELSAYRDSGRAPGS